MFEKTFALRVGHSSVICAVAPHCFEEGTVSFCSILFVVLKSDRMLLIGNHRDAWVYGGGDPSSGTAALVETSRVIGNIKSAGML